MLLEAAREEFTQRGYNGATVRAIAARASVDPAMVNHWFGNKEGLFSAAMSIPVNLADVAQELVAGEVAQLGERIVRRFLTVWDTAGDSRFVALMRSVATHEESVVMLREFVISVLFRPITRAIGADNADLRAALCGSQIIGLGITRYVMRLEPLASADHDTVARAIAPNLQRYLTGEVD
jgi:AcrR family transcriptional regulator